VRADTDDYLGEYAVLWDAVNAARFSPRLPNPVHFFGHIRQKIGRGFSLERKTRPDWQESALPACQKSAGIDRLQVEKPGADVFLAGGPGESLFWGLGSHQRGGVAGYEFPVFAHCSTPRVQRCNIASRQVSGT
jgi:hypothetical protein